MEELYHLEPFSLDREQRKAVLVPKYQALTQFHYDNCRLYKDILDCMDAQRTTIEELSDVPFIPVRLFKQYELLSIPQENVVRTVTSSGTTGQVASKIFMDKYTALWQQKVLTRIVGDFIGRSRMPLLVIDCPSVVRDKTMFSTRGSGILGFATFGTERVFALKDDMSLDEEALEAFLKKHAGKKFLLFGFTFIIWKHFLLELEKRPGKYDLSHGVLIHGGGWKKLKSEAVSKDEFKQRFKQACSLWDIHENYGMAEQTGSIFVECECGHLHASIYSDVVIRNSMTLKPCPHGQKGIMQVMSLLPHSYPGHSLLTEDEGIILGEDDCPCGRKGKYFMIIGRLSNAELRGCSDTYAAGMEE